MKPKILILTDYYLPGYRGGGPIRSVANLIAWLGTDYEFQVVTSDRDLGDHSPYPGVLANAWTDVGAAAVLYLAPHQRTIGHVRKILSDCIYDAVCLYSYFSPITVFTLHLRRLELIPKVPIIVSPDGEFSKSALAIKKLKKQLFLAWTNATGLHDGVFWKASSQYEAQDIARSVFYRNRYESIENAGVESRILVAPQLPPGTLDSFTHSRPVKQPGQLRIAFVSRIAKMKNLDGALRILAKTQDHVILDIYGPNEDPSYWKECQSLIEQLPGNLQISYLGPILHEQVADTLSQYHVLFLPTLGENYGHIIVEALQSGCLVIISDRTPWRNLAQAHVGWDLPLESTASFVSAIHEAAQMDEAKFRAWSTSARQFAASSPLVTSAYRANRSFLQTLCSGFQ